MPGTKAGKPDLGREPTLALGSDCLQNIPGARRPRSLQTRSRLLLSSRLIGTPFVATKGDFAAGHFTIFGSAAATDHRRRLGWSYAGPAGGDLRRRRQRVALAAMAEPFGGRTLATLVVPASQGTSLRPAAGAQGPAWRSPWHGRPGPSLQNAQEARPARSDIGSPQGASGVDFASASLPGGHEASRGGRGGSPAFALAADRSQEPIVSY